MRMVTVPTDYQCQADQLSTITKVNKDGRRITLGFQVRHGKKAQVMTIECSSGVALVIGYRFLRTAVSSLLVRGLSWAHRALGVEDGK